MRSKAEMKNMQLAAMKAVQQRGCSRRAEMKDAQQIWIINQKGKGLCIGRRSKKKKKRKKNKEIQVRTVLLGTV